MTHENPSEPHYYQLCNFQNGQSDADFIYHYMYNCSVEVFPAREDLRLNWASASDTKNCFCWHALKITESILDWLESKALPFSCMQYKKITENCGKLSIRSMHGKVIIPDIMEGEHLLYVESADRDFKMVGKYGACLGNDFLQ